MAVGITVSSVTPVISDELMPLICLARKRTLLLATNSGQKELVFLVGKDRVMLIVVIVGMNILNN